ncbi:hypothetical protein ACTSEZ_16600, partial [Metabacillus sp. JX24]|uniref:hypothetical protein n=1 Tax=Metabacillus sp. JX24 TaxID=3240759 RepID=UPI003510585C
VARHAEKKDSRDAVLFFVFIKREPLNPGGFGKGDQECCSTSIRRVGRSEQVEEVRERRPERTNVREDLNE